MNIFIFAADSKGSSSLNGIVQEVAQNKKVNYFALLSKSTTLQHPAIRPDFYNMYTNVDLDKVKDGALSTVLNVTLPFTPDWLIVQRERWAPEQQLIQEMKQVYNCKVAVVEANAQTWNNLEVLLETKSKNRMTPLIDVFFDHSSWIANRRKEVGFDGKVEVVGNPKYDLNLNPPDTYIQAVKKHYKVDDSKKKVLLFTLVNASRKQLFEVYDKIIEANPDCQFFIKPYPGEPTDNQFTKDYAYATQRFPNATAILEDSHIWAMFNICDVHVGALSSIFHASLLLEKTVYDVSSMIGMRTKGLNRDLILNGKGEGVEDKADLWMRTFEFTNISQLEEVLDEEKIKTMQENNESVWKKADKLLSLGNDLKLNIRKKINYTPLLPFFDDFCDKQASKRIVKYILNDELQK